MTTDNDRSTFGAGLDEVLAELEDEERFHLDRLKEVREDRDCIIHAGHLSLRTQTGMMQEGRGNGYGIHSHIRPIGLAHVRRIWDAYIEIALMSGGFCALPERGPPHHGEPAVQLIQFDDRSPTPSISL